MIATASRHLGELLVERKVLSRDALNEALVREADEGVALSSLLVNEGLVEEKDLIAAVAQQVGLPFVDLATRAPRPDLVGLLPPQLAISYRAVPIDLDGNRLIVALENPGDEAAVGEIGRATGFEIAPALAERGELSRVVTELYQPEQAASSVQTFASSEDYALDDLLRLLIERGGSDLHLTVDSPPAARIDGEVRPLPGYPVLTGSSVRRLIYGVLTQSQRERFERDLELDASYSIPGVGRFRVNVFVQRSALGAVMRAIPHEILPFESLGLPPVIRSFAELPRGLVLVTGPTGSGKSTTLASLIDHINENRSAHIMTVEDPIEFVHRHKRCIVNQREIGEDTLSFTDALKHVLRQDPDVILLGELRDLETIHTALTAAETGHLVFATLHTQDAPQSVDRIVDVFPPEQQQQIRVQLASTLRGVVTQTLVKVKGGGRAAAIEVMVVTPAVRNLIREGKNHQIYSAMQSGAKHGMQTMDQSLAVLVRQGRIEMAQAIEKCADVEDLKRLVGVA